MFLLDTNILSELIRHPDGDLAGRIAEVDEDSVVTSIVVAGELRFDAERRGSDRLTARVNELLTLIPVLPLQEDVDHHYGHLRTELGRRGQPIGANDMWIAAHTLAMKATLVTDSTREFERTTGLHVENWIRPE